jgi:hypothetical protein
MFVHHKVHTLLCPLCFTKNQLYLASVLYIVHNERGVFGGGEEGGRKGGMEGGREEEGRER